MSGRFVPGRVLVQRIDRAIVTATDLAIQLFCLMVFGIGLSISTAKAILDHAGDGLPCAIADDISPALLPLPILVLR